MPRLLDLRNNLLEALNSREKLVTFEPRSRIFFSANQPKQNSEENWTNKKHNQDLGTEKTRRGFEDKKSHRLILDRKSLWQYEETKV